MRMPRMGPSIRSEHVIFKVCEARGTAKGACLKSRLPAGISWLFVYFSIMDMVMLLIFIIIILSFFLAGATVRIRHVKRSPALWEILMPDEESLAKGAITGGNRLRPPADIALS